MKRQIARSELAAASSPRLTIPLNRDWFFRRLESMQSDHLPSWNGSAAPADAHQWELVNLPHSVRLEPLNASGGRNFQGVCWYCRNLELPGDWKGKTIYLHFEGAMQVAEVWLNDRKLATNHCGYLPLVVDLTSAIEFESRLNILAVRLDNRDNPHIPPGKPQAQLDFTYFGGLYRNVRLEVMDRLHIADPILSDKPAAGLMVSYPQISARSARVRIRTSVINETPRPARCTVLQELSDASGRMVAQAKQSIQLAAGADAVLQHDLSVSRPRLWHPFHPNLYTLCTTVLDDERPADELTTRIGIRHIRFDRRDGLLINGEKFFSIGANRHQDHPYVGYAMPDSAHYRDVKKLREAGFTSCRSHYPQSPAFMDACDELGMLTIVSNPGWQFVGDELFQARAIHNARLMVRRDRNRPSVILWEAALNESDNRLMAAKLQQAVHEEFPGDQCFTAGDREPGFASDPALGWDVEYLHNDGKRPYWIREWGDHVDNWSDQQSRSRVPRRWGEFPMLVQAHSHAARMGEILSGPKRPAGACLWAGIDCQRGYHRDPFHGGALDLFRLPKFNYHFFKSQCPPELRVPGLDFGPMVFIANFATFLSPTAVTVFSNCDEVRLILDGREIGRQKPGAHSGLEHPPMVFQVECFAHEQSTMYMTGVAREEKPPLELVAEGIIAGKVVTRHTVRPPGVAAMLALEADLCGRPLIADGSDWVRVYAKICDRRGTVCPFADDLVSFSVEGEGKIIADQRIAANPARAEAGIATVLLQSTGNAGTLAVRAAACGLKPATLQIQSLEIPSALQYRSLTMPSVARV